MTPESLTGRLAWLLGLRPRPEPLAATALLAGFELRRLPAATGGLVVDPVSWGIDGGQT